MTRKVLDIHLEGNHLVCVKTDDDRYPFRLYRVTYSQRKQIAKYSNFFSVIVFIKDFYLNGVDSMTLAESVEWAKDYTA